MAETGDRSSTSNDLSEISSEMALLGKYEVGKLLGYGAFAKVYQARNMQTGETVAIKAVSKKKVLRGKMMAQVKREIAIMRRLNHPNIVKLIEVLATKSKVYFVMEYAKGGEFLTRINKGRFSEELCRRYFQQLISAVGFCHSRGVFHRDLKPENLLFDENWNLKVTDFGLSTMTEQVRQDGLLHTFCGTPAYVAPEILSKKGYDGAKADIWSCGIVLFVLHAGYLPFNDANMTVMYRNIYRAPAIDFPPFRYKPGNEFSVQRERFVSAEKPWRIIERIKEEVAKMENVEVISMRESGIRLEHLGNNLVIAIDINQLTEELVVVEAGRRELTAGSSDEIWNEKLKPRLSDLVYNSESEL
ncbi:hypothetical protein GOBAR_DD12925 [Gossypium barbadense]|nr:hypothetical protein GOBAR_DD12925 [Gossypium barbadense]